MILAYSNFDKTSAEEIRRFRDYHAKRFEVEDAGINVENALRDLDCAKKSLKVAARKKITGSIRYYLSKIMGAGNV